MKLNHDCVRDLLLAIEKHAPLGGIGHEDILELKEIEKYQQDEIIYTAQRLNEAGFIKGNFQHFYDDQVHMAISNITYDGHNFLDTVRDNEVWRETKNTLKKVSSASIPIIFELGTSYLKSKLGIS